MRIMGKVYSKLTPTIKKEGQYIMAGKTEYKNKWQAENCERISLVVPKGKKDIIKAHAESQNESLNGFVNRAIDEAMKNDEKDNKG